MIVPMHGRDAYIIAIVRHAAKDGSLRAARERADLYQTDVAQVVGASSQAVSRWESGVRVPRRDAALRLGRLLAPYLLPDKR